MCCKTEDGEDRVLIPMGVGHNAKDAEIVEIVSYRETPITNKEAAQRFHAWMRDTVSGEFYDLLKQELNSE